MQHPLELEERTEDIFFTAGWRMVPGRYRELNSGRIITLEAYDTLPASLDGRVACYVRLPLMWLERAASSFSRAEGGRD